MSEKPCECEEIRLDKNGREYIVCRCPKPPAENPFPCYGLKQSEWKKLSRKIIARDNGTCRYCGSTEAPMQCDHVVPFTRGGTNDETNLVAACADCNRSKRNTLLEDWKGRP